MPSQGSLSKDSTRDTKRNMYVSSSKTSIRGRRADGTVCRVASARCALGATDSDRSFGRWHIHITFGITSRVHGKTALRWAASGDAGAAPRSVAPPLATSAADSGTILAPRSAQCRGAAPAIPVRAPHESHSPRACHGVLRVAIHRLWFSPSWVGRRL